MKRRSRKPRKLIKCQHRWSQPYRAKSRGGKRGWQQKCYKCGVTQKYTNDFGLQPANAPGCVQETHRFFRRRYPKHITGRSI